MLTELAALLRDKYVFPERGAELSAAMTAAEHDGRYDGLDAEALAERVTADLRAVHGDGHLALRCSREAPIADFWTEGARTSAGGMARVEVLAGNIGYLAIRPALFPAGIAGASAVAAMTLLADTEALVLDVRQCQGGAPDMVALLSGYLFDEAVHLNDVLERDPAGHRQFWTPAYLPGRRYGETRPVYVLTGPGTFSGAEELAFGLQQRGRATVVGERTGGGANPVKAFGVDDGLEALIPVATARNPVTGGNWEGTGVTPDVEVEAARALETALELAGSANERLSEEGR